MTNSSTQFPPSERCGWRSGVLSARAAVPGHNLLPAGLYRIGRAEGTDAAADHHHALYVPPGAAREPLPLVVLFHGAGGSAPQILPLFQPAAEQRKFLLLAPKSASVTWDLLSGGYGPDVEALDRCLRFVLERFAVDGGRMAMAGFSDGASYALSLGLINGQLFRQVFAFSPGFAAAGRRQGKPLVLISHGTQDTVLPIAPCSRRIVSSLQQAGYEVRYTEFVGGHQVPPELVAGAVDLLLQPAPARR
ncbi:MAG: phospholipase/Carboxylesterase [Polaromonas sp.]|nr:phospholipase/Carboxylesterase [Polaromonas sp.]